MSLFSFWDSNYTYVRLFNIFPHIHKMLHLFPIWFSLLGNGLFLMDCFQAYSFFGHFIPLLSPSFEFFISDTIFFNLVKFHLFFFNNVYFSADIFSFSFTKSCIFLHVLENSFDRCFNIFVSLFHHLSNVKGL